MSLPSDEEIAILVQNGDAHAFGVLVERFEAKMQRYARKFLFGQEDAEDVVQEVFLKAYRNIRGFDSSRSFSAWLYRIAHNEFINAIKKKSRRPLFFFDPDTFFPHPIAKETADQDINDKELKNILDLCLEKIDLKYREPLILFYYEELDYKEISEIMRLPIATVGVRLNRGKKMLRDMYKQLVPSYE